MSLITFVFLAPPAGHLAVAGHLQLAATRLLAGLPGYTPTTDGLPGGRLLQQALNWGGGVALAASLGGLIYGGGSWAWSSHQQNYGAMHKAKMLVMGGAVGAIILGVAPLVVATFFNAGTGG